jgi:hypothetical protein
MGYNTVLRLTAIGDIKSHGFFEAFSISLLMFKRILSVKFKRPFLVQIYLHSLNLEKMEK